MEIEVHEAAELCGVVRYGLLPMLSNGLLNDCCGARAGVHDGVAVPMRRSASDQSQV
jgi:hypothetical protein